MDDEEDEWQIQIALQESIDSPTTAIIEDQSNVDHMTILLQAPLMASWREHRQAADAELAEEMQVSQIISAEDAATKMEKALAEAMAKKEEVHSAGVWDCDVCTYRNPPFFPYCQACEQQPPAHILTFQRIQVNGIRYGVEVEVLVEKGRRDGYSEPWVAQQLTQLGVETKFAGYSHETTTGHWKIVTDASLKGTKDDLCIEVVSPILHGESGIDQFRQMLEALRCLGIATNSTCGFHVHVDATQGPEQSIPAVGTLQGRKIIAHAFCCLEGAFDELVARAENARGRRTNRNQYCQSNVLCFGSRSRPQMWECINAATSVSELVERISPDRYYKLNLHNLIVPNRADTMEFRQHGGVDDAVAAEAWVRLILGFVTRVAHQTKPSPMPPQPYTMEQDLQQLFQLLECPGLESYYTMERRLFDVNNKVKEWRCKVCHKPFRRSQDLARHSNATNHY